MTRHFDLTGQVYGRLTVVKKLPNTKVGVYKHNPAGVVTWECLCSCGNVCSVSSKNLKAKVRNVVSCGCRKLEVNFKPGQNITNGFSVGRRDGMSQRDQFVWYHYKLTPETYQNLLAKQAGHCATCPATEGLHIDHDHKCCPGKVTCGLCVRGLLCGSCNRALGHAKENSDRLRKLADYAEKKV